MARFAGLRCPSELSRLRWSDVDWAGQRFTVHSPKTEHHEGGASRVVPIFPQVLPYLRECFELAEEGAELVVPRASRAGVNINPQMRRIVERAGLVPWPKMFANLRSSCATDLQREHPMYVACSWLGHSPEIAAEHYLQVTESDYQKAVQNPVQNAVRHVQETVGRGAQTKKGKVTQVLEMKAASTFMLAVADPCILAEKVGNGQGRT